MAEQSLNNLSLEELREKKQELKELMQDDQNQAEEIEKASEALKLIEERILYKTQQEVEQEEYDFAKDMEGEDNVFMTGDDDEEVDDNEEADDDGDEEEYTDEDSAADDTFFDQLIAEQANTSVDQPDSEPKDIPVETQAAIKKIEKARVSPDSDQLPEIVEAESETPAESVPVEEPAPAEEPAPVEESAPAEELAPVQVETVWGNGEPAAEPAPEVQAVTEPVSAVSKRAIATVMVVIVLIFGILAVGHLVGQQPVDHNQENLTEEVKNLKDQLKQVKLQLQEKEEALANQGADITEQVNAKLGEEVEARIKEKFVQVGYVTREDAAEVRKNNKGNLSVSRWEKQQYKVPVILYRKKE